MFTEKQQKVIDCANELTVNNQLPGYKKLYEFSGVDVNCINAVYKSLYKRVIVDSVYTTEGRKTVIKWFWTKDISQVEKLIKVIDRHLEVSSLFPPDYAMKKLMGFDIDYINKLIDLIPPDVISRWPQRESIKKGNYVKKAILGAVCSCGKNAVDIYRSKPICYDCLCPPLTDKDLLEFAGHKRSSISEAGMR